MMYVRIDVALSRQAVLEAIQRRMEAGEPVTLEAIALEVGCCTRTVSRAIQDLKCIERLQMTQHGRRYIPTQYEILGGDDAICE